MEQRLGNSYRMTVNEKKFIEQALVSDLRVDGRRPFDYRRLTIKFGSEDGSSEVQLGQTHVMAFVTSQLVQPYRDRPNEGALSIFIEFSPMADPSFEAGRPGEFAVELGRIIDRGLRESRAVDTESLCVLAGKLAWAIRVDLHILDNGGNLVDAANVAALAALLTFRRPECTVGGEDGQEVIVHPPEVKEPHPLIIHHLPVAVTFAFFGSGDILVIDPTHYEEAVMRGRMTATINSSGDVCAVQKSGGEGVMQSVIMQCMRVASLKAADITSKIKNAVEAYNTERALKEVKQHSSSDAIEVDEPDIKLKEHRNPYVFKEIGESLKYHENRLKEELDRKRSENDGVEIRTFSSQQGASISGENVKSRISGPSNWDPYSKGIAPDFLRRLQASPGSLAVDKEQKNGRRLQKPNEFKTEKPAVEQNAFSSASVEASDVGQQISSKKSLMDAVKPKNRRKR
eukprot:TRINITY_DN2522_c1_g1_i6.p1 TRINITY_DN2522_c1_g1~~TRINITY_DN2522_c1_g1_i6.p1  ORF type:complete len:457 (+),score=103.83 TRINITY_DN2522_c1_g1_i6:297-1667(+)